MYASRDPVHTSGLPAHGRYNRAPGAYFTADPYQKPDLQAAPDAGNPLCAAGTQDGAMLQYLQAKIHHSYETTMLASEVPTADYTEFGKLAWQKPTRPAAPERRQSALYGYRATAAHSGSSQLAPGQRPQPHMQHAAAGIAASVTAPERDRVATYYRSRLAHQQDQQPVVQPAVSAAPKPPRAGYAPMSQATATAEMNVNHTKPAISLSDIMSRVRQQQQHNAQTAAVNADAAVQPSVLYGRYGSIARPASASMQRAVEASAHINAARVAPAPAVLVSTKAPSTLAIRYADDSDGSSDTAEMLDTCDESMSDFSPASASSEDSMTTAVTTQSLSSLSPRSLCMEPSWFQDSCSPQALLRANSIMADLQLPGSVTFMPVSSSSYIFKLASSVGFTAFSVSLGSSYFQRLLNAIQPLRKAVLINNNFAEYAAYLQEDGAQNSSLSSQPEVKDSALRSIQVACVYLAEKVADRAPGLEMLRFILSSLYGALVSNAQAAQVEVKCLEGLQWRLGPFFEGDPSIEDDDDDIADFRQQF